MTSKSQMLEKAVRKAVKARQLLEFSLMQDINDMDLTSMSDFPDSDLETLKKLASPSDDFTWRSFHKFQDEIWRRQRELEAKLKKDESVEV